MTLLDPEGFKNTTKELILNTGFIKWNSGIDHKGFWKINFKGNSSKLPSDDTPVDWEK